MEKSSRKVNAKMFLQDFRDGKSDEELMRLHSLTPGTLDKVMRVLLDKNLLDPSELRSRRSAAPTEPEIRLPVYTPPEFDAAEPAQEVRRQHTAQRDASSCPQCGAPVTSRMLSCPECGHVLPGAERWEAVEPKKALTERIPPLLLGCIIALPIAVILFFLFKDVILPMSEAPWEKRADALRKELPPGKTPIEAAEDMAKAAGAGIIKLETQRLMNDGVISAVNEDYTVFTAGSRWPGLSQPEKRKVLHDISSALRRSAIRVDFDFVNDAGEALALVKGQSIELYDEGSPKESSETPGEIGDQPVGPAVAPDILNKIPKYRGK